MLKFSTKYSLPKKLFIQFIYLLFIIIFYIFIHNSLENHIGQYLRRLFLRCLQYIANQIISKNLSMTTKYIIYAIMIVITLQQGITIRNRGCKAVNSNGVCNACSTRFYLDAQKICQPVNPNCNAYNQTTGACTSCYQGFGLLETTCLPGIITQSVDPNCHKLEKNVCLQCSFGYFLNKNSKKCTILNPLCKTSDPDTGVCRSCYPGYQVNDGNGCSLSVQKAVIFNCNQIDSETGKCIKCSSGYYFDQNNNCIQSDPNCKTVTNNICISCYSGFDLIDNNCVKSKNQAPSNSLCAAWNNNNICTNCSKGSYLNGDKICTLVNPLCLTHDKDNGYCLSCFIGYTLSLGSCILSNESKVIDPFCQKFLTADICEQCSERYYIGDNGLCREVNPFCKSFNLANGNCYTCYPGYILQNQNCITQILSISDNNCKTWKDNVCIECAFGAYFAQDNLCKLADPLCKTFDHKNGNCLTCFSSFVLVDTKCVNSGPKNVSDVNCAQFFEGVCTKCSSGFIFNATGYCSQISSDCKTFIEITGRCTSCYFGFDLINGSCVRGINDVSSVDKNCAKFASGLCVQCSKGFYFGPQGKCLLVDPLCKTFDPLNGRCLTCFPNFVINDGSCIKDTKPSNCIQWFQGACVSCAFRNFVNQQGQCQQVNINCNTYSSLSGLCTSCYAGYSLKNGVCSLSISQDGCSKINQKSECIECGKGSYLKQGRCIIIDPQCANFEAKNQICVSCYQGFTILNGACQISKVEQKFQIENCYAYNAQSTCIKCYDRFFLRNNLCQPVDIFCRQYDDTNGNCISCFSIFNLLNGKCLIQQ